MLSQADAWFEYYRKLKNVRRSASWRADVVYFDNVVRPKIERVNDALSNLDLSIAELSSRNVRSVELGANRINISVWLFSILVLSFVVVIYVALERSLLRPIASVAQALFSATRSDNEFRNLPTGKT